MPPERNNTVRFTQLSALSLAGPNDIIPIVDTSIPTLVNKKITISGLNQSLPVVGEVTIIKSVSSKWDSVYASFNSNSAEYESTFSNIISNSSSWDNVYTNVSQNSAGWNGGNSAYTNLVGNSAGWAGGNIAYSSLNSNSATWVLKAGDQITGTLTTTKTLTSQFTNVDEFVSKRYVDAVSTISGNFVPSLYYTRQNMTDGIPGMSAVSLSASKLTFNRSGSTLTTISDPLIFAPFNDGTVVFSDTSNIIRTGAGPSLRLGTFGVDYMALASRTNGVSNTYNLWIQRDSSLCWGNVAGNFNEGADLFLFRDAPYTLAIRDRLPQTSTNVLRVYSNYIDAVNNERFALSGNRIAYELSGSQRFFIASTAANVNGIIGWANNIGGFNTLDVYNFSDWQFSRGGGATHILRAGGTFETRAYGGGLSIDDGSGIQGNVLFEAANTVGIRNSTNSQNLRVYNTYTNATNYERLSLSATRIAYEFAGTGVSRDLTIVSTGNLVLSAGGNLQFSQSLPLLFSSLSASSMTIAPTFANNNTLFAVGRAENSSVYARFRTDGSGQNVTISLGDGGSNQLEVGGTSSAISFNYNNESPVLFHTSVAKNLPGSVVRMGGFLQVGTSQPSVSSRVYIAPHVVNSVALTLSGMEGQAANIFEIKKSGSNILTVSNNLLTMIGDLSATGNLYTGGISYSALSAQILTVGPANAGTGTSGSLRIANDTSGVLYPGIYSTGNGISLATYGNGGLSNTAHARTHGLLAGRSVFSGVGNPGTVAVGSGNFDETIPNIAIKIGGNIGFTDGSLDGSSFVRPISATMGYDWSSNLISLSSRTSKVGFRFEPVEAGNNRPEIYSDTHLYITNNFGGGRAIYFNGSQNQGWNPFELRYNGAFAYGTIEITATQQPGTYTFPYFKITQDAKQLSNLVQIVSSNGSTILSYSSAGVLNLNSRIFLKPDGLIQFTNTSSTTPAIKGTATTVQARTGDDSQYTYLQGKLQTDQAASAGTFTPDKYIILYDSTGTAYKVPVQAL